MLLLHFPNELLLQVAQDFGPKDLLHLIQVNRLFANLLIPVLHKHALLEKDGMPALFWAAWKGYEPLVALLLKKGVDITEVGNGPYEGKTALHIATKHNRSGIIRMLVRAGSDIEAHNDLLGVLTPFREATSRQSFATMRLLCELGADIDSKDSDGFTLFHEAAAHQDIVMMKILSELGAAVDSEDNDGLTPFNQAAIHQRTVTMKFLCELGVDIDSKDSDGLTPFRKAATHQRPLTMKTLCELGADVNSKDNRGLTALHEAANDERTSTIELLCALGADVDSKNNNGLTPFREALNHRRDSMMRVLCKLGADVDSRDSDGLTALQQTCRPSGCGFGDTRLMWLLIGLGANVNSQAGGVEKTALHLAVDQHGYAGTEEILRLLLGSGADITLKVHATGDTALHIAVQTLNQWDIEECIKTLLEYSNDINTPNNAGKTALHLAAGRHIAVMRLLLEKGANSKALDQDGKTVLDLVAPEKKKMLAKLLLSF